jgi:hypothetical protein
MSRIMASVIIGLGDLRQFLIVLGQPPPSRLHLNSRPRSTPSSAARPATSDVLSIREIAINLNARVCHRRLATPTSIVSVS